MSIVKNEAKYKNPLLVAIREQLEHRAYWLYLLCDEAGKRGLDFLGIGSLIGHFGKFHILLLSESP